MGEDLSEYLLADLEVLVAVKVLEETLGVQSVSSDDLLECLNAPLNGFAVFSGWVFAGVDRLGPHILNVDVVILLQALLSKDLINSINKVAPADMLSLLRRFKFGSQQFKFLAGDLNFRHVQANAELALSDESRAQLVEVPEELPNANALLFAENSQPGDGIFDILRGVTDDLRLAHAGLGLREVVKAVIEIPPDSEQHAVAVHVFTEINVIDFIEVAFVHVTSEDSLGDVVWRRNLE